MDAASTAINKMFHGKGSTGESEERGSGSTSSRGNSGGEAPSLDQRMAPAVEHETVQKQHEQREQTVIDKERHQDHYKTTVQPLKDREVMPEEHRYEQGDVEHRHFQHDRDQEAKRAHERKQSQFKDTLHEAGVDRKTTSEPALTSEHVHHHLHETIQPIIEKGKFSAPRVEALRLLSWQDEMEAIDQLLIVHIETVMPSVTHKTNPIKEMHQERAVDEGVSTNKPISKEEFKGRLRRQ